MMKFLNDDKIRRIIVEGGVADESSLSDPEILKYVSHEFRFLSFTEDCFVRQRDIFLFLENNGLHLSEMKILDIGCGDGLNILFLKQQYDIDAIGVDIQSNSLVAKDIIKEMFKAEVDIRLVNGDADDLPVKLKGEKFDLIFLLDLVEHLEDPELYMQYLAENLLTDKGYVLVLFPPYWSSYGGHYELPYVHYLPLFLRKKLVLDPFKHRAYNLNGMTVSRFEKSIRSHYDILDKKMTFQSRIKNNFVSKTLSKTPGLREVLSSLVYLIRKK